VSLSPHPSGKPATFPTRGKALAPVSIPSSNTPTNPNLNYFILKTFIRNFLKIPGAFHTTIFIYSSPFSFQAIKCNTHNHQKYPLYYRDNSRRHNKGYEDTCNKSEDTKAPKLFYNIFKKQNSYPHCRFSP